jgi:hypothetical protein
MLAIAFVFVRMISRSRMLVLALEMMRGVKSDQIECLTGCKAVVVRTINEGCSNHLLSGLSSL